MREKIKTDVYDVVEREEDKVLAQLTAARDTLFALGFERRRYNDCTVFAKIFCPDLSDDDPGCV